MKIKKMTATFGSLDNAVLEPGDGLTVIAAPNEAGKSTWAGFLKAMLYGIDTGKRNKTGFLSDKARYLPWSGAPMAGEMLVEWQGKDILLRRFPTRTNPFGGFEAVYAASGDPVPDLTAANVGEQLTGVSREVYLRSAFVGQGGAAIGASGELEARISALATSGQEDTAYSDVERTLKDWRNRRRANRANGLIPQLEEDRAEVDAALEEMAEARRRRAEAEQELASLQQKRRELQTDLEVWERLEKHEVNRRYTEAYTEWALEENRRRNAQREELGRACRRGRKEILLCACLAVISLLIGLGLALWSGKWAVSLARMGAIALAALAAAVVFALRRNSQRKLAEIRFARVPEGEDWLAQAVQYRETLAQIQQAKELEAAARRRVSDLAAQGGQLADTLEMLHPPVRSKAAAAAQLAAVEGELARVRGELARTEGELAHMGGAEDTEARRALLDQQLARRMEEYDALTAALDALDAANAALRERFSPALNREAGQIFAALTGGRWDKLTLARDFTAQASQEDGLLPRSWLALSAGTADQLYLSVRLAVCALTVPDAPVVLDDALAAFDDGRCALALDYLREAAGDRQILLFSCHSREAEWAGEHHIPVIHL